MKHFKNLLKESQMLTVFEMLKKLEGFLHEKYGIKSFGAKKDNGIKMYMSKYLDEEKNDTDLSSAIKTFITNQCNLENVEVHREKYGYHITFGHDAQAAKLIETTQADGSGISGPNAKKTYICAFCKEEHEGHGNDPWPLANALESRACDNCNMNVVIPARLEKLYKNKNSKTEAAERKEVEHAASNIILDKKYIWLFNVMDDKGRDVEEGIEYLQDAIDSLISNNAAFLVAFPYVDPKPEDTSVDIIFADNPGPIIIYNNEEATIPKSELERPSKEAKPKEAKSEETNKNKEEDEEMKKEAKQYPAYEVEKADTIIGTFHTEEEAIAFAKRKKADYVFYGSDTVWQALRWYNVIKNGRVLEDGIDNLADAVYTAMEENADFIVEVEDRYNQRIIWTPDLGENGEIPFEESAKSDAQRDLQIWYNVIEEAEKALIERWDNEADTYYRVDDEDFEDLEEAIDTAIAAGATAVLEVRDGLIVRVVWEPSDELYDDEDYYGSDY